MLTYGGSSSLKEQWWLREGVRHKKNFPSDYKKIITNLWFSSLAALCYDTKIRKVEPEEKEHTSL